MSDPLFSVVINDKGQMNVAVRRDFWDHEDKEVILQVLTIATFLMSDNEKVVEAKRNFVDACSEAFDSSEDGIVPQEFAELCGLSIVDEFEVEGDTFVHPIGKGVH